MNGICLLFAQPTTKVRAGQSSRRLASHCATNVNLPVNIFHKISNANFGSLLHSLPYCSSQSSMVHWLSSSISPCSVVCPSVPLVTSNQISTFFNIYRHTSLVLTQFHLKPSSTKLYWPSTTKYQPVPPHIDPAPPNTDQNCLLLTQYQAVLLHADPINTIFQPILPYTDPVPPITNQ